MRTNGTKDLTDEEARALGELALGHTDEVAAARLELSLRTFRRRVRVAMDKLGARSRFQAGVLYGARTNSSNVDEVDPTQ